MKTPIALGSLLFLLSACAGSDDADTGPAPVDPEMPVDASPAEDTPTGVDPGEPEVAPVIDPAEPADPAEPIGPVGPTPVPAPAPTASSPSAPAPPTDVAPAEEGPSALYLGRSWRATARTAQDVLDARGLAAMRALVDAVDAELGLASAPSVERACPGGGSANRVSAGTAERDERRYAFAGCELGDGRRIDGVLDTVSRVDDEGESVKRGVESYFDLTGVTSTGVALAVRGTSSDALSGRIADACGLIRQERVLRLDIPAMTVGGVEVGALAVEDITNARPAAEAGVDGGCAEQLTEYAFSDSARIAERGADGERRLFGANRTGSVVIDARGAASSSGSDASLRAYAPAADDSLEIVPDFTRPGGATVTVDEHPGRTRIETTWAFVETREGDGSGP